MYAQHEARLAARRQHATYEWRYARLYRWWAAAELAGDIARAELFANEIQYLGGNHV